MVSKIGPKEPHHFHIPLEQDKREAALPMPKSDVKEKQEPLHHTIRRISSFQESAFKLVHFVVPGVFGGWVASFISPAMSAKERSDTYFSWIKKEELAHLSPDSQSSLKEAIGHLNEEQAKAFLELYRLLPDIAIRYCGSKDGADFAKMGAFFVCLSRTKERENLRRLFQNGSECFHSDSPLFREVLFSTTEGNFSKVQSFLSKDLKPSREAIVAASLIALRSNFIANTTLSPSQLSNLAHMPLAHIRELTQWHAAHWGESWPITLTPKMMQIFLEVLCTPPPRMDNVKKLMSSFEVIASTPEALGALTMLPMVELRALMHWHAHQAEVQRPAAVTKELTKHFLKMVSPLGPSVLDSCDYLLQHFPGATPLILKKAKEDPIFLIRLKELSLLVDASTFDYLLRKYATEPMVLTRNYIEIFKHTYGDAERKLLQDLIDKERRLGCSLLPLFIAHTDPSFLHGSLYRLLMDRDDIASHFDVEFWKEDGKFNWLVTTVIYFPSKVIKLFELTQGRKELIAKLIADASIWDEKLPQSILAELFNRLSGVPQDTTQLAMPLMQIAFKNEALIPKILSLPRNQIEQLLKLVKHNELDFVSDLLNLSNKDELKARLLAQLSVETAPLIRAILRFREHISPELLRLLAVKDPATPFDPQIYSLMALLAQGDEALVESAFDNPDVMKLVIAGEFAIARDLAAHRTDSFWRSVALLDVGLIKRLHGLHLDLSLHFSSREAALIERVALQMALSGSAEALSWLDNLQCLLRIDPEAIRKKSRSIAWQALASSDPVSKEFKSQFEAVINGSTLSQESIDKAIASQLKAAHSFEVGLADLVLTRGGTINRRMLDALMRHPHIHSHPYAKQVLEALQQDPAFGDRLQALRDPPGSGTRQNALVKAVLGLSPTHQVSRRDAQVAVLSALLWPMRQSQAGSCFATALVIQMNSSSDGLKQSLEDYLMLVTSGQLPMPGKRYSVPMSFDPAIYRQRFQGDNFLARAREFTIASFGEIPSAHWMHYLDELQLKMMTILHTNPSDDASPDLLRLPEYLRTQGLKARYLGYIKRVGSARMGGWVLVDPVTERPVIESRAQLENSLLSLLEDFFSHLRAVTPSQQKFHKLIKEELMAYVRSDKFLREIFAEESVKSVPFGYNPDAVRSTPFTIFDGGSLGDVVKNYFNVVGDQVSLSVTSDPLEGVFLYIQNLPEQERAAARRNPRLLKSLCAPGHIMNLRIGYLLPLIEKAGGARALVEMTRKANRNLMQTPLTPSLVNRLLIRFAEGFPPEVYLNLGKAVREAVPPPQTVGELCQLILRHIKSTHVDYSEMRVKSALYAAISKVEELSKLMLEALSLVDTNWEQISSIVMGLDFGDGISHGYLADGRGPIAMTTDDEPLAALSNWEVFESPNRLDAFSRRYFQAA